MKFEICNIWDKYEEGHVICIPTNGYVKKDGLAVVGRGVARQAQKYFPDFSARLGNHLSRWGNVVTFLYGRIVTFPVKPTMGICSRDKSNIVVHMQNKYSAGDAVMGWACKASIEIIQRSLWELDHICKYDSLDRPVYLPKPGCGNGGLDWEIQVKPLCEKYGDWLIVVDRK